ncbi:MAG: methyltransferase family protein [Gemmatimonadales bacterium]
MAALGALFRGLTYATLFVGLLLLFLPARLIAWSGIDPPGVPGPAQWAGLAAGTAGGILVLACILTFAVLGRGTPAPFDPPRRLVVRGPYRHLRNPMYLGAGLALLGGVLYYGSLPLLGYLTAFMVASHLFVLLYEEPTLQRLFGPDYTAYRAATPRWIPRLRPPSTPSTEGRPGR